ncbi:efflux RND transporter periplasmic adaptor subunit [Shewanella sp. 0m-4]
MQISTKTISKFAITPLALCLLSGCSQAPAQTTTITSKIERPVQIMQLNESQLSQVKQFSGVLEATQTAYLAFKVAGTIEAILVNSGDSVLQGQLLATLEPHDYQVNVAELNARLEEAKAAHQLASAELKRVQQAIADDAISAVNLDRTQSGYKRSLAMVEVVNQNLQKAKDALRYTELRAPFDGVIGSKSQQAFEQTAPGNPLFSLHQLGAMKAVVDVPENLMAKLNNSTLAEVRWHGSDKVIKAKIGAIDTLADPIKQTYKVEFVLNHATTALPGKAVQVDVAFKHQLNRFCVPYAAIVADGKNNNLYVIKSHRAVLMPVNITSLQSHSACLTGELTRGDQIITAGVHYIAPDQLISNTIIKPFSY